MAKHKILDYSIKLVSRHENSNIKDIDLSIRTEISKKIDYYIHQDDRYPDLDNLINKLNYHLNESKTQQSNVEISYDKERWYLRLIFSRDCCFQFGAHEK